MRHHRQRPAGGDDLAEQPQRRVGVGIGDEPLGPVGERLGADPDRLQLVQARVQQRLDVAPEHRLPHDHRIASGDQDAGHFGVLAEIGHQRADIVGCHLQLRLVHKLCPPEAVGAVRVAGLALPGEEQHRLRVLVLQAGQWPAVQARRVQQQLPRRVRVQPHPDLARGGAQAGLGSRAADHVREPPDVRHGQHVRLGEDEPVDGVGGGRVPVNEVLDDVRIRAEWEHRRHRPDGQPFIRRQTCSLHEHVQMFRRVSMESASGWPGRRDDLLGVCHAPSPPWCARHGGDARGAQSSPDDTRSPAVPRPGHIAP